MSKKSIVVRLFALLMCVCMLFATVGCGNMLPSDTDSDTTHDHGSECTHTWVEANCTTPKTCSLCKATEGEALGHSGGTATCTGKAKCAVCGVEYGELAAHSFDMENWGYKGADGHAHACTAEGCAAHDTVVAHTSSGAATEEQANTCTVCAYIIEPVLGHTHVTSTEWSCDETNHWHKCTGCETERFDNAAHVYDKEIVIAGALKSAATCTSKAVYYKSCVCGVISKTETFQTGEALAHVYNESAVKAGSLKTKATCTTPAIHKKSCACGAFSPVETDVFTVGSAKHDYTMQYSDSATCTTAEVRHYCCNKCGDSYDESVGDALGHSLGTPSERCVEKCDYVLVSVCERPQCAQEVEGETLSKHNYTASITTPATCMADGEKKLTCGSCGDEKTEVIEKSDDYHVWVKGTAQNGTRTDTCACGAEKSVAVITGTTTNSTNTNDLKNTELEINDAGINLGEDVLNSIGDKNVTVSAEKTEGADRETLGIDPDKLAQVGDNPIYNFTINDGTDNISEFGEDNYVTITLPYTLEDGEDVDSIAIWFINDKGELKSIPATYNNGYVTFRTNHFSYYTVTRLTPAERCELYGHSYTVKTQVGSCTKDGYDLYFCVRCHETHKENEIIADGHDYETVTTAATCTTDGSAVYTCKDCAHSYTTKLLATGHSYKQAEYTAATCTANGFIKYACEVCGDTYTVSEDKIPHTYVYTVTKAPTCAAEGVRTGVCSCGDVKIAAVAATGIHSYGTDGKCTVCGRLSSDCTHEPTVETTLDISEYGMCITSIEVLTCACGEYFYIEDENAIEGCDWDEVEDSFEDGVDADGNEYEKGTMKCDVCGAEMDICATVSNVGCVYSLKYTIKIRMGEAVVIDDLRMEYSGKSHDSEYVDIDVSTSGACGGSIEVRKCADCGEITGIGSWGDLKCELSDDEDEILDDQGNIVGYKITYTCAKCGLTITEQEWREFTTTCKYTYYEKSSVKCGDTVIAGYEDEYQSSEHDYDYTFAFDNTEGTPNCEDGVTVTRTCKDCGYSYTYHNDYHSTFVKETIDLTAYGACGATFTYDECPCGAESYADLNSGKCEFSWSSEWDADDNNIAEIRTCRECGLKYRTASTYVLDEATCMQTETRKVSVKMGGIDIVDKTYTNTYESHDYKETATLVDGATSCKDGITITGTCSRCGDTYTHTSNYHHAVYEKYDFKSEYGACEGYVEYMHCPCGEESYFYSYAGCHDYYDSETVTGADGYEHEVTTYTCSKCKKVVVVDEYTVAEGCKRIIYSNIKVSMDGTEKLDFNCSSVEYVHDYDYTFAFDNTEGTPNCEDGVTINRVCKDCGDVSETHTTWHETFTMERHELSESGACGGYIALYSCACGEETWRNENFECDYSWTDNRFEEDGVMHYVETRACKTCGLRYDREYYTVRDASTCTAVTYYEISVTVNSVLVCAFTYQENNGEAHMYTVSAELVEGAVTCEDGVILTYTCKDCGYSDTDEVDWHDTYETQRYDLSEAQYGASVCGGYVVVRECACGENSYIELEDSQCEFDEDWIDCWVDGYLNGVSGVTADNPHSSFWHSSCIMACAVTDPQCTYKIRRSEYWLPVESECKAIRYKVWQLGYNSDTDTYACEIKLEFETRAYHRYAETSLYEEYANGTTKVEGTRYDCPDCGSYYEEAWYYTESGKASEYIYYVENKLNDGKNKSFIANDLYDESGNHLSSKSIYTRADGSEYGEEYAYEYHNGYQYDTYYVSTDSNGYWYRCDYTYNFDGTCERTETYTNSDGEYRVYTDSCHRGWVTGLEPTCTQDGYYNCAVCGNKSGDLDPYEHNWEYISENLYECKLCGLQNSNGADGDIVFEDFTAKYGEGNKYVVGYWARNEVEFTKYVSIVLADGIEIILDGIDVSESSDVRAYEFSKSAVEAAAAEKGHTDSTAYDVRFTFVPKGADSSFDYAITLTDEVAVAPDNGSGGGTVITPGSGGLIIPVV